MAQRLKLGQYCGRSVRQREVNGFLITENWFSPGIRIDRHIHEHAHFTFILEGGFTESYDRIVLDCVPDSILFVPANRSHTDYVAPVGAHTIGVELSPELAKRVIDQTGVLRDPRVLSDVNVARAGRRLYHEFRSSDAVSSICMEAIALEMLVLTSRARIVSEEGEPRWMSTVRETLHTRFADQLSLRDLAKTAGIHKTHLARTFRRRHGCTIGDYLRKLRVEAAALALIDTDRTVADIAAESGFFDLAHFCRIFKREYGQSPSSFRAR